MTFTPTPNKYLLNKEMMKAVRDKLKHKCPCNLARPCPCDDFLNEDLCKCGMYTIYQSEETLEEEE